MHVLVNALSARAGGGWTYLVNLLDELERDPRGIDFTFLVPKNSSARLPSTRFELMEVDYGPTILRIVYEQLRLPSVAKAYDLLFCVADIAPRLKTVPTIAFLRNLNIYDRRFYDNLRLKSFEAFVRLGLVGLDRALAPSRAAADAIATVLGIPPDTVSVVPHGIDAIRFRDPERSAVGSGVPNYVFIPAAVEKHKNLDVVVEALAARPDEALQAWIAGGFETDPTYRDHLLDLARTRGVADRFRLLGPVDYERIPALYADSVALVFPSLLETFGHPLIEAMATGTPVVASDLPVFHEIGGGAGWYFDPMSGDALADTIDRVRSDAAERGRRVRLGRSRADEFSWKSSIDRLCEIFEEVVAHRDGSAAAAGRLPGPTERI